MCLFLNGGSQFGHHSQGTSTMRHLPFSLLTEVNYRKSGFEQQFSSPLTFEQLQQFNFWSLVAGFTFSTLAGVAQEQFVKALLHRGTEFLVLYLRIHPGFPLQEAQSHNIQREGNQNYHGVITREPAFYLSHLLGLRAPEHISKM